MKAIIVIPTYDEKDNVRPMAEAILSTPQYPNTSTPQYHNTSTPQYHNTSIPQYLNTSIPQYPNISTPQYPNTSTPQLELLFVDDNSPDGTGRIVDEMSAHDPRIHCLHRTKKEGLGRAYIAGFERALELGADFIIQMDCDFSHDPKDIPRLLEAISSNTSKTQNLKTSKPQNTETSKPKNLETQKLRNSETSKPQNTETSKPQDPPPTPDLVIGSRYVKGGSTPGWPFKRRLISRAGGIFIRTITGMPLRDPTGGFKCWKASTLRQLDLATIESAGYSFQLEMNHRTWKRGLSIQEIPIVFHDRELGYSKITPGIAVESIKIALHLRFS